MSILSSPLKGVLRSPLSSPLFSGSMWWLAFGQNANFAYDLANNRYMRSGGASTQALSLTEDRASSAMVLQGNGTYVERAAGELAIGQGVGLQVSEAVTNYVSDPSMSEAVVGTPGTGPRNWDMTRAGLTANVVGLGTEDGLPYIELNIVGTMTTGNWELPFQYSNTAPTADGETWFNEFDIKLIAGTDPSQGSTSLRGWLFTSGGSYLSSFGRNFSLGVEYSSAVSEMVISEPTVGFIQSGFGFSAASGTVVDFTIRLRKLHLTKDVPAGVVVLGSGDTNTRSADNPVVVQGFGLERVTRGDFSSWPLGWEYDGSAIEQPYVIGDVLHIPREVGATFIIRQQIADDLIIGKSYFYTFEIVDGGLRPRLGHFEDNGSYYAPGTTQYPGVYGVPFVATSTNLWAYFLPLIDNSIVSIRGVSAKQVFPYPGYNPDSQAYAETLTQFMTNPVFSGTVGAITPDSYGGLGSGNAGAILEEETVGGIQCQPFGFRRTENSGYQGIRVLPQVGIPVGTHLITYYLRRVSGVTPTTFAIYHPSGTPDVPVLELQSDIEALDADVWHRRVEEISVTSVGSYIGIMSTSGAIGTGFDIALFNVILNTTQDVETQSEQGAFSRILAGDGFASTVFPSEYDLLEGGGFDSQADVDLWGPSSTDPEQIIRTEVDGRMELVRGSGGIDGQASFNVLLTAGTVYALESVVEGHLALAAEFNVFVSANTGKRTDYGLAAVSGASAVRVWNFDKPTTVYVDSLSVQEVEPGAIIEAVGVLNIALNQYVMWLLGSTSNDGVILRCRSTGFLNMIIKKDGVTLFDITSPLAPYPDGVEATIRLEITNTPAGCFFAVFKDGVAVPDLMAGPIAYPDAINTLSLIPVAGVKTITEIYGK